MLVRARGRERSDGLLCLELIKNSKDNVRVNFLEVAKALLRVCRESQIEVVTKITKRGYRTYIVLSPNDDPVRCIELFRSLLAIYIPDSVRINESSCNEVYSRGARPF